MTAFYELAFFPRSLFGLWAFLLCCAGIFGVILAFVVKRYGYMLLSLAASAPAYLLWQVVFNIYRAVKGELPAPAPISAALGALPWLLWLAAFLPLSLAVLWPTLLTFRYSRTAITPLAIKECGDGMSCGLCYWQDNGRVIFSNISMNRLCLALTGEPLLNGNSFRAAAPDTPRHIGDEVWRFTFRDFPFHGRRIHEMIAWDITETHAKTEALRRDNEELARMTEELKAYSLRIDDVVRRQEILQAKISIHDEMNHLMLSTVAADRDDIQALDRAFAQWQKNALLLCREAEEKAEKNAVDQLERLAGILGVRLHMNSALPDTLTEEQRELFYTAAREATVNAVKHGEAKALTISFAETEDGTRCLFENGGSVREGTVRFTGGLANLQVLAAEQGASVSAEAGKSFRLSLLFPKKTDKYAVHD